MTKELRNICKISQSDQAAVIFCDQQNEELLTKKQFLNLANSFTHELNGTINDEDAVLGIFSGATLHLPVIIYSLLQQGITFAPLSLDCKPDSLENSLQACSIKYIIVHSLWLSHLNKLLDSNIISSKYKFHSLSEYVFVELDITRRKLPVRICYIVQSSGTTGEPKHIFVPQNCVKPNVVDLRKIFEASPLDVVFIPSALTFDASLVQMFLAWSCTGSMVMVSSDVLCNPTRLFQVLSKYQVTILQCTPSLLLQADTVNIQKFFNHQSSLRILALGGEEFPSKSIIMSWLGFNSKLKVYNIYGTSEMSSWASIYHVDISYPVKNDDDLTEIPSRNWVPIGEPLSNTTLMLFDGNREIIGDGEGEICLVSCERKCFINNKIYSHSPETFQRTGDLGECYQSAIYYCGRKNKVVKRNGKLVSLYLLQKTIEKITEVTSSVCLMKKLPQQLNDVLVVFVCSMKKKKEYLEQKILNCIQTELASQYLPERIIFVDQFPISLHGKVDEKQLMKLSECMTHNNNDDVEEFIKYYWSSLLNLSQPPTLSDQFTVQGGNSFSAVYLLNKLFVCCLSKSHDKISYEKLFEVLMNGTYQQVINTIKDFKTPSVTKETCLTHSEIAPVDTNQWCHKHFFSISRQNKIQSCLCFPSKKYSHFPRMDQPVEIFVSWKYDLRKCIDASPLVVLNDDFSNGIVYIGSHSHVFAAVMLDTGEKLWETMLNDRIESSATIGSNGELICVGCYSGLLYFLNSQNGNICWTFKANDTIKCSPCIDYAHDILVFGCHDKNIYAIKMTSRICLWNVYMGSSCFSSPLVYKSSVIVCLLSGGILSLTLQSGVKEWKLELGKPVFSSPCLCKTFICVGCVDMYLYAIDFFGQICWKYQVGGPIFSSPVFVCNVLEHKDLIVFGCNDSFIYCIDLSGQLVWKYQAESPIYSSCTVFTVTKGPTTSKSNKKHDALVDKQVIVSKLQKSTEKFIIYATTSGSVGILDFLTGECVASIQLPYGIYSSPVVTTNKIIIGCRDNYLYCLDVRNKTNF